jgi:hypothetical protein
MFLGIIFDHHINFNSHIDNIIDRANKRLNIVKILAHRPWKLSYKTLINVYKTIMRSVLEYSSILIPHLAQSHITRLQTVQNKALRIIFQNQTDKNIEDLRKQNNLEPIKERFNKLILNYFLKAIESNNPIILNSVKEFNDYANGRVLKYKTLNCPFKS